LILERKKILLTGAGRGIGRTIAELCAKEGAQLFLISRTESELKTTLEIVKNYNNNSSYYVLDISDESSTKNIISSILKDNGNIDILINNAGVQLPIGQFYLNDLGEWKKNIEVNLFGMANVTYYTVQEMIKTKKGKVINLSGGGSTSPRANFSAYGVSKTAVVRFTETLAVELKKFNIDVNAVSPGAINTRMLDEVITSKELSGVEYQEALRRKNNGGGDPITAARLICYLASDLSDGISGKLISANWDPWEQKDYQELLRADKDLGSIRRIDNKTFFKKS